MRLAWRTSSVVEPRSAGLCPAVRVFSGRHPDAEEAAGRRGQLADRIAGWRAWRLLGDFAGPEPELGWVDDSGFLTGAAGIGLALLGVDDQGGPARRRRAPLPAAR